MIPGLPSIYVWAGLFLSGVASGGYGVHTWYKGQATEAIEESREIEDDLQDYASGAEQDYVAAVREQVARAEYNAALYRRKLNASNQALDECRVSADILGVLDAAELSGPPGVPAESVRRSEGPAPALDSSCGIELDKCRANYAEVCVPNAIQLRQLRDFTQKLILDYNISVGRD